MSDVRYVTSERSLTYHRIDDGGGNNSDEDEEKRAGYWFRDMLSLGHRHLVRVD